MPTQRPIRLLAVFLCLLAPLPGDTDAEKPLVAVSNYPLQWVCEILVGDQATVVNLTKDAPNPREWVPDDEALKVLEDADLIVLHGFSSGMAWAVSPVGPAYDLFLFHGKAQLDYEGSGSKNHGRTPPYTYVGSVTSWALANGATVTFRGNEARIVKHNSDDPCEEWATSGSGVDVSRWLYSRTATTDIGIAFPNMYNTDPEKRWPVNCVQKIDANQNYGDDTHAAAGIIAVSRDLINYHRDTFSSNMTNEQDRIGVLPVGLDWMVRELAIQAADNLYPGAISSGQIIVTPVIWNRFWADGEQSNGATNAQYLAGQRANGVDPVDENGPLPVHGQNLSLEVTIPLNKHVSPGAEPGAWIEPIGAVYVGMDSLNARLYLGQNAYIRLYADEMDGSFTLEDAIHITERDTVKVDDSGSGTVYVYTGPFKWLNSQTTSNGTVAPRNHVARITKSATNVKVELFEAQAAYDPQQTGLAYLLGSGTPTAVSTVEMTRSGSVVNLTYSGPEHNGTAVYSEISNGWRVRHTVGSDYNVCLETTEQSVSNVSRVTRKLLDPANNVLETKIYDYQNFKLPNGYEHTIPYEWQGSASQDASFTYGPVDDWRVVRIQDGSGPDQRVTAFQYETAAGPSFGKLKGVTGADGESETLTYDSNGRLETHTQDLADSSAGEVREFDYTGGGSVSITVVPRKVTTKLNGVEVGERTTNLQVGETTISATQTIGSGFTLSSVISYQDGFEVSREGASGLVSTQELYFNNDKLDITTASGAPAPGGTAVSVTRGSWMKSTYDRPFTHILEKEIKWLGVDGTVEIDAYKNSNDSEFIFDVRKRITAAKSPGVSGNVFFERNLHGVTKVTDRHGRTTVFGYETHGQHTGTTYETWKMNHILSGIGSHIYSFPDAIIEGAAPEISSGGILKKRTDPEDREFNYQHSTTSGVLTLGTTEPSGAQVNRNFYLDGRPKSVTGSGSYEMNWAYTWGAGGVPQKEEVQYASAPDEKTTREYDSLGRLIREVSPDPDGTGVITSIHVYDANTGLKVKIIRDYGANTLYTYDNLNRIHQIVLDENNNGEVDPNGLDRIQEWEYKTVDDASFGPSFQSSEYVYPKGGQGRTRYRRHLQSLDGLKSKTKILNLPDSTSTTVVSGGNPRIFTTTIDHSDGSTEAVVTSEGLVTSRLVTTSGGTVITEVSYKYDNRRFLEEVNESARGITSYEYYDDGRVHKVITPVPGGTSTTPLTTTYAYSGVGSVGYPNNGTQRKTTLPDSTSTITETFSPQGELLKREGALNYPVAYTYDHAGRRKTMTTWKDHAATTGAAVTQWEYNDAGMMTRKIFPDASNTCLYTYHSNGVMKTETLASGAIKNYTTDQFAQVLGITYTNSTTPSVTNTYDRFGRIATVEDASGKRTYEYDTTTLQLDKVTYSNGIFDQHVLNYNQDSLHRPWSVRLEQNGSLSHVNVYEYETGSSRLKYVYGNDKRHEYTYTAGRGAEVDKVYHSEFSPSGPVTLFTDYDYDAIGRLTFIGHKNAGSFLSSNTYQYNSLSQRVKNVDFDGTFWEYDYDDEGQLTSAIKNQSTGTALPGYTYEYDYDDIGNRKTRKVNTRTTTYTPNSLNQYSNIVRPAYNHLVGDLADPATTIDVDLIGDGLGSFPATITGLFWDREMDVNDPVSTYEITATTGGNSSSVTGSLYTPKGTETPQHDVDGNQSDDFYWEYTWDAENRLIRQEHLANVNIAPFVRTKIEYEYDSQNRRFRKTVFKWDGNTNQYVQNSDTLFLYDGWNLFAELDETTVTLPGLVRTYTWGKDLSGSLQGAGGVGGLLNAKDHTVSPAVTVFAFADGIGNVRQYFDHASGQVIGDYEYAPFGKVIKSAGSGSKQFPHRFASKYECSESGHLYFGYRSLNPETGSWLSRDPIGEKGGLNLYGYANNDPINGVDVLGLGVMDFLGGVADSGKTFVVNTSQGIWNIGSEVVGTGYGMLQWASDGPTALIHGILPGEQNAKYARFHGQRFMSGLSTAGAVVDGIHSETIQLGMSVLEGDIEDVFQRTNSAAVNMTGGPNVTSEERALRAVLILSAFKKPTINTVRPPVAAPGNFKLLNKPASSPLGSLDDLLNYNASLSARAGSADLIPDYLLRNNASRVGGSGFTLNPVEWYRTNQIVKRARAKGLRVERPLWGQSAGLVDDQITLQISPLSTKTVAVEEYLHGRFLQMIGPRKGAQVLYSDVLRLGHEVRLKSLMLQSSRGGFLGSGSTMLDEVFLMNTRLEYSADLMFHIGRSPDAF